MYITEKQTMAQFTLVFPGLKNRATTESSMKKLFKKIGELPERSMVLKEVQKALVAKFSDCGKYVSSIQDADNDRIITLQYNYTENLLKIIFQRVSGSVTIYVNKYEMSIGKLTEENIALMKWRMEGWISFAQIYI